MMTELAWRYATLDDVPVLARLNKELTEDEGHRNRLQTIEWFAQRMAGFLQSEYTAVVLEKEGEAVAYALFRPVGDRENTVYLRQLYVVRRWRRQGVGREMMRVLRDEVWAPGTTVTVEVMSHNEPARAFYAALGFVETYVGMEAASQQAKPCATRVDVQGRALSLDGPASGLADREA